MQATHKLLTTINAAKLLGVSDRTVRFWAECCVLPAFKIGKQWRFDELALLDWMGTNHNHFITSKPSKSTISNLETEIVGIVGKDGIAPGAFHVTK